MQLEILDIKRHIDTLVSASDLKAGEYAYQLITSRQNISPKRLVEPGPNRFELEQIFQAAAAAPDHGLLCPWRIVIVPQHRRADLGEVFALALIDRDSGVTAEQIEAAREKANRSPLLMLVVAKLGNTEPNIPVIERMVAVGAAIQNVLLQAHDLGYGGSLTSGQAMTSHRLRALFCLEDREEAVCFINIGTVDRRKIPRIRPASESFVSML